ncbi:MAG TPA: hypothetical protein VMS98_04660 [Thermoanaerobaculia bacterium]|nr:hypothetical protein [Thermoanaerobaculia bacterium]
MRILLSSMIAAMLLAASAAAGEPTPDACDAKGRVTLHVERMGIRAALREIARQGNINLALSQHLRGTVSADFTCVPPKVALQWVLTQVGASYCEERDVLRVLRRTTTGCRAVPMPETHHVSSATADGS